jgi:hypothetical protein
MFIINPANIKAHKPGAPCPVEPDTSVWVLLLHTSNFIPMRAGIINWENYENNYDDIILAWAPVVDEPIKSTKTPKQYEKIISDLKESNYELSVRLSEHRVGDHVTHLFGMPLDKLYDIIQDYNEKSND